jgi:hypothetical protein
MDDDLRFAAARATGDVNGDAWDVHLPDYPFHVNEGQMRNFAKPP